MWAAVEAQLGGADGITVHLREDRRHIQDEERAPPARADARQAQPRRWRRLDEMVEIARRLRPEMAMLVPEGRHEITTEGGLDIVSQEARLREQVARLADAGIVVSVFIAADPAQVEAAKRIGAAVCEVHTGPYAHALRRPRARHRQRRGARRTGENPRGGRRSASARSACASTRGMR
ncbi:MAG: pyridoxine 5'-phosphate synthase [Burkholderiales bacterium]|nr:pyridoxine 5'-phosphate synthase [Burkholderiales bacterium]